MRVTQTPLLISLLWSEVQHHPSSKELTFGITDVSKYYESSDLTSAGSSLLLCPPKTGARSQPPFCQATTESLTKWPSITPIYSSFTTWGTSPWQAVAMLWAVVTSFSWLLFVLWIAAGNWILTSHLMVDPIVGASNYSCYSFLIFSSKNR